MHLESRSPTQSMDPLASDAALPPLLDVIAGVKVVPSQPLGFSVTDASTGKALQPALASSSAQVEAALVSAEAAFSAGDWSHLSPEKRAEALDRVAKELDPKIQRLATLDSCTSGVTLGWTSLMTRLVPMIFRLAGQALREGVLQQSHPGPHGSVEVHRVGLGPVALIGPWNAPATIMAHKLASALAAGCNVVIKPSEHVPHSTGLLVDAVLRAGLPKDTVQLLHGDGRVGQALASDPRIKAVSFTGGLVAGRAVAAACALDLKPAQLELGGNNPLLVLSDAEIESAADAVVAGLTTLNGQWCRALGRVLAHRSVIEELLERVEHRLARVRLGHALDPSSKMGPLVHPAHLSHVQGYQRRLLKFDNCRAIAPTKLPKLGGHFHAPTLVSGVPHHEALDELFGPVATIHAFDTEQEALALANEGSYGLAAYVFGEEQRSLELGRRIRAGSTQVNGLSLLSLAPKAPRSAWGLSGLGDEGTLETLRFFTGNRVIGVGGRQRGAEA